MPNIQHIFNVHWVVGMKGLDLARSAVSFFWQGSGPRSRRVIDRLERLEGFTPDDRGLIDRALIDLGRELGPQELVALADASDRDLVVVLGYVKAGRALRILKAVHEVRERHPRAFLDACLALQTVEASTDPHGERASKIMIGRFEAIAQYNCLSRVFNPARARDIEAALSQESITL